MNFRLILLLCIVIVILIICYCYWRWWYNSEPIDLVYTWVDGDDPLWEKKKNKYSSNRNTIDDATRYTSIDELKYSLRSVYKYANWVNKIYIVVDDDQKPKWLNTNHPKIQLVKHSEIFPDKSHLPTFNSHAIECHLHRIPNLTEHFIYMNDDVFFGKYISKRDFYKNNKMNYFKGGNCIYDDNMINNLIDGQYNGYYRAWNKTQKLVKENITKIISCQHHGGIILKKSNFQDVKQMFPREFAETSSSRFRSNDDIVPNGLAYQYGLNRNNYRINTQIDTKIVNSNSNYINSNLQSILYNKPDFFCINNVNRYNKKIIDFLENYYSEKSPYEN